MVALADIRGAEHSLNPTNYLDNEADANFENATRIRGTRCFRTGQEGRSRGSNGRSAPSWRCA